jgi:hypothetical protein
MTSDMGSVIFQREISLLAESFEFLIERYDQYARGSHTPISKSIRVKFTPRN